MSTRPILDVRQDTGTDRAMFKASPSRWESSCNAAVASSHPLESYIASNTCWYCSQLVVPPNRGTLVNAACRGVGTTGGSPGVLNCRDSALISAKSCCNRATVSIKMFRWFRTNIPLPSFRENLWSDSCASRRQPRPRSPEAPVSINLPLRWSYFFCLLHVLPSQWQRWSRSSALLYISWPTTPPVASAFRTLGSSGTDGGRPARFHFVRAILSEPHAETPSETSPPAEYPMLLAHLGHPPPADRAHQHPSGAEETQPPHHPKNPSSPASHPWPPPGLPPTSGP